MVMTHQHGLMDGIAMLLLCSDLSDEPSLDRYPNIAVRMSWLQSIITNLVMPFYLVYILFEKFALTSPDSNGIKDQREILNKADV